MVDDERAMKPGGGSIIGQLAVPVASPSLLLPSQQSTRIMPASSLNYYKHPHRYENGTALNLSQSASRCCLGHLSHCCRVLPPVSRLHHREHS